MINFMFDQETIDLIKKADLNPKITANCKKNFELSKQVDIEHKENEQFFKESSEMINIFDLPTTPSKEEFIIIMQDCFPEMTKEEIERKIAEYPNIKFRNN